MVLSVKWFSSQILLDFEVVYYIFERGGQAISQEFAWGGECVEEDGCPLITALGVKVQCFI